MREDVPACDYRIGDWVVRVDRHELQRGDETRRVQPRLIALLGCLAAAGGRTVSRDELLAGVWQRRMVNDEVLSRAIADLRRALDDDARQAVLIETVPKLGYRLCVPVRPIEATGANAVVDDDVNAVSASLPRLNRAPFIGNWRLVAVTMGLIAAVIAAIWWMRPAPPGAESVPRLAAEDLVHARPLAGAAEQNLTPRFSRSGGLYAFSAVKDEGAEIHVRSRDGRVEMQVGNEDEWDLCPLFSADGSDLIWTRHDASGCRLMRMPIAGGAVQELAACARRVVSCPDLDGDGERVLYSAADHAGLSELHLQTGAVRAVTHIDGGTSNDADPRYSPDGSQIAFLRGRSSDREVMVLAAVAAQPRRIDEGLARRYGLAWLDAGHLLLATDSEGPRALVSLAIDDGRRVLLGAPGARRVDRADDGALIWEVAHYRAPLMRLDIDGSEHRLSRHQRSDGHPMVSPDGRRLVFQSNREGPDAIWLLDLVSGEQRRLPLPVNMLWLYPSWLPDGKGLLLVGQTSGVNAAWRYHFDAAAPQRMSGLPGGLHQVQMSVDGAVWFLLDGETGGQQLWRFHPETAASERLADAAVAAFQVHRSGVYVQHRDSDVLWRCELDASGCADSGLRLGSTQPATWTLSDERLFHQSPQADGSVRIMRRALQGDEGDAPTPWTMPTLLPHAMAMSADGDTAWVAKAVLDEVELYWLPPPALRLQ